MELKDNTNVFDSVNDNLHTSVTLKNWTLLNYCRSHYISYISVYGLGQKYNASTNDPIVGNFLYFDATKEFLKTMHQHGVKVGIVISNKGFLDSAATNSNFITSPFVWENAVLPWDTSCASSQRNTGTNGISGYFYPYYNLMNPSPGCSPQECYAPYETSEMLKQIMRVLQYSIWTRDSSIATGCTTCTSKLMGPTPPTAEDFLFDYMSLEYEFWDASTYESADTAHHPGMTKQKAAWNNLCQFSEAMLYVYAQMCNFTKMELELKIVAPDIDPNSSGQPTGPGDTSALEMPPVSMQVEYLARAFNRILISDYKDKVGGVNIISKTAAAHTKFAQYLNDLNPDERHKFMPVFSAATKDSIKQCFGSDLLDPKPPHNPLKWIESFFGPILAGTDTSRNYMHFFEQLYLTVIDSCITRAWVNNNCKEYKNDPNSTCLIDTTNIDIVGFMWYNYGTLSDSSRIPIDYNRLKNKSLFSNSNLIHFNYSTNTVSVIIADENIGNNELQIINMQGSMVFSAEITESSQSYKLTEIPTGVYLCRINGVKNDPLKISIIK